MVQNNVEVAAHPVRAERALQPGGVNHDVEFADRRAAVRHELERGGIVIVCTGRAGRGSVGDVCPRWLHNNACAAVRTRGRLKRGPQGTRDWAVLWWHCGGSRPERAPRAGAHAVLDSMVMCAFVCALLLIIHSLGDDGRRVRSRTASHTHHAPSGRQRCGRRAARAARVAPSRR